MITNLRMKLFQALEDSLRALTLLHATGSRLDPAHCVRVADGGRRRGGAGAGEAARSSPRTVPYLTQGNAYILSSVTILSQISLSLCSPACPRTGGSLMAMRALTPGRTRAGAEAGSARPPTTPTTSTSAPPPTWAPSRPTSDCAPTIPCTSEHNV